jgi:pyruvate/2-oxoglutarate dehydrogenase complex dihydrolipoamide acyltransferase (E2) component
MKVKKSIIIPKDNVNDEYVMIKNIYVSNNDKIKKNILLIDYETSKANFEVHSEIEGFIKLLCSEGDSVKVGEKIIEILDEPHKIDNSDKVSIKQETEQKFSKKANDKIVELNIDRKVFNSKALITEAMVVEYYEKHLEKNNQDITNIISISPTKSNEIVNLTNQERFGLVSSVSKKINVKELNLDKYNKSKEFKGSLSILLINVISKLLSSKTYMHLNSYVDGSNIHIYNTVNFGLALNLGDGLKVGVIHNSNKKNIEQLENRVLQLIDKYIDGKMEIRDVSGATITLTDLTEQKIESFTPLILKDNSVMFGLSGIKGFEQMITIAFDHRVSDGLEISNFLNRIIAELKTI